MDYKEMFAAKIHRIDRIDNPNELVLTKTLWKDLWKIRIHKMADKFKDVAASQWAAPILLAMLLGYNVYSEQSQSARMANMETDLTILKTQKEDAEKYQEKELTRLTNERFSVDREMNAWKDQIFKQLAEIKEAQKRRNGNGGQN